MNTSELLQEAFGRIGPVAASAVEGLSADDLVWRPDSEANSVAWLVWHLARVQDDHVAEVADREQVWTAQGFARRFDLPFDDGAIGYGQSSDEVAQVRVESPQLLTEYLDAVLAATQDYLGGVTADDLDRVVDDRWDPPVTLAVRLVSVLNDDLEHAGQASYVRGLLDRRS
jgi:uncharacterized damage-inducible protein DinB